MSIKTQNARKTYLCEKELSDLRRYEQEEVKENLKLMDDYLKSYKNSSDSSVRLRAKQSLIRSGVLTKNGKPKRNIVNR